MKVGTRYSMFLGGALFGTAFATAGAGVAMHSLPLLYFGNCKFFRLITSECSLSKKREMNLLNNFVPFFFYKNQFWPVLVTDARTLLQFRH